MSQSPLIRPNCYECPHRGAIEHSKNSKCTNPKKIIVTGAKIGVENGWFMWPFNFDPVWVRTCNGFEWKK